MEKFSQFRDKATGIAPFLPVPPQPSGISLPFHAFLFAVRVPLLISVWVIYFIAFSWLSLGSLAKKAALWLLLAIPGLWWIDLQIDGVKKGSLAKTNQTRLPGPGTVIVSSHTSPIDALYLAAIFDPIFTASYPNTRKVQRISLFQAILRALLPAQTAPPANARLTTIAQLLKDNPDASIVVFPESTTSNGRGILPFSPSLLTTPSGTKIFPISLRYTPQDITTPIPGTYLPFLWRLCSKPTHCIRVRIAEPAYNMSVPTAPRPAQRNSYETNFFDDLKLSDQMGKRGETLVERESGERKDGDDGGVSESEQKVLDRIAEDLARLGRVKRVGLGVEEKISFVRSWTRNRR